jgi:hypothetical protein
MAVVGEVVARRTIAAMTDEERAQRIGLEVAAEAVKQLSEASLDAGQALVPSMEERRRVVREVINDRANELRSLLDLTGEHYRLFALTLYGAVCVAVDNYCATVQFLRETEADRERALPALALDYLRALPKPHGDN